MKYAAIIFDMDGTIVDTENLWIQATKQLIEEHGIQYDDPTHTHIRSQIQGMAMHNACFLIQQTFSLTIPLEELITRKVAIARKLYEQELTYIRGFESFIQTLKGRDIHDLAVATNADDYTITATDRAVNLRQYFGQHIYGIESVGNKAKPNPDIYLFAADRLGVDPTTCLAIEDSAHGVQAAKNAGMYCIGINSAGDAQQLRNADRIIQDYHDLSLDDLL